MAVPWPTPMPVLMRVVLIQASRWRATEEHPHARHWRNEATSVCASAWSSTTITAGSFSHRTILATGPEVGKGQVVLKPGPPHRPKASGCGSPEGTPSVVAPDDLAGLRIH